MRCPRCGTENREDARVCQNCGLDLTQPYDTQVLPPAATSAPAPVAETGVDAGGVLSRGWGSVIGSAVLTFVILALVGEGLAALAYASSGPGGPGLLDTARIGSLFTYSFHRVGVHAALPEISPEALTGEELPIPGGGGVSVEFVIAVSMLLGTLLLVWLLYRAGKALGERAGGPWWLRGLSGARLALPYALITGIVAVLLSLAPISFDIPAVPGFPTGGEVELKLSLIAAFLWPLGIAAFAGFAGGVASSPEEGWARSRAESLAVGALRGGVSMAGWGVLLGFIGLQVVAFVHSDVAAPFNPAFFESSFRPGPLEGVTATVYALMFAPNLGALVLAPSMGSVLGVYGGGVSFPLLSYLKFPTGFDPAALAGLSGLGGLGGPGDLIQTETAPLPYWLFLLVPLLATILGGRRAAVRADAASAGGGAAAGALAGVVYGLLVLVLAVVAGVGFRVDSAFSGISQSQTGHLGPDFGLTLLVALAWGLGGGSVGGLIGASGRGPAPVPGSGEPTAYGFETQPGPTGAGYPPAAPPPAPPVPPEAGRPEQGVPPPPPMSMPPDASRRPDEPSA